MASYYIVRRAPGPAWKTGVPLRSQDLWSEHVVYMNELESRGVVVLGGPVGRESDALLVIDAESEQAVEELLARDPWSKAGMRTDVIEPWTILLDGRRREP